MDLCILQFMQMPRTYTEATLGRTANNEQTRFKYLSNVLQHRYRNIRLIRDYRCLRFMPFTCDLCAIHMLFTLQLTLRLILWFTLRFSLRNFCISENTPIDHIGVLQTQIRPSNFRCIPAILIFYRIDRNSVKLPFTYHNTFLPDIFQQY